MIRIARGIFFVVAIAGAVALLMTNMERNLASLGIVKSAVLGDPATFARAKPAPSDSRQRLYGSVAFARGDLGVSQTAFEDYLLHTSMDDRLVRVQLADVYYRLGDKVMAGKAYEKAGLLDLTPQIKSSSAIRAGLGITRLKALEESTISLAIDATRRQDYSAASVYASHSERLSDTPQINSQASFIQAQAEAHNGRYFDAVIEIRRSLDMVPSTGLEDVRMKLLAQAGSRYAQQMGCTARTETLVIFSLVVHLPDRDVLTDACYRSILTSTLNLLSPAKRPYLLLGEAMTDRREQREAEAERHLREAELAGLPPIWSDVLMADGAMKVWSRSQPAYALADKELSGYELSPLQVESGLPLDIILFYRGDDVRGQRVKLYQAINEAPDPGFEFSNLVKCSFDDGCPFGGYVRDIYGMPQAAHQIAVGERPITSRIDSPSEASSVLRLTNKSYPEQSSGVTSSQRPLVPDRQYLQACWVRSIEGEGSGYIGRRWEAIQREPPFDYVVAGFTGNNWQYANEIVKPPLEASGYYLWLINFKSSGDVEFDDCVFTQLP